MHSALAVLVDGTPLPSGWRLEEPYMDTVRPLGGAICLAGLRATQCASVETNVADEIASAAEHRENTTAIGSAARVVGPEGEAAATAAALVPAYFELIERISVLDAERELACNPSRRATRLGDIPMSEVFPQAPEGAPWAYSRSNGVAIARTGVEAQERALLEVVERDAILRSWYGETTPFPLNDVPFDVPQFLTAGYRFIVRGFPSRLLDELGRGGLVVGVFGLPIDARLPIVSGYAARFHLEQALSAALAEALQRLGFLWGEEIDQEPCFSPTPDYHQEYYLHASRLPLLLHWLEGGHLGSCALRGDGDDHGVAAKTLDRTTSHLLPGSIRYVDLTPQSLRGRLWTVKALVPGALPLTFGRPPPFVVENGSERIGIHPVA